ncbi:hypothetical protein MMC19_003895 [Ptychographa xylographoides]|nr:hypothetical protein [Ptychographa xylographoides]
MLPLEVKLLYLMLLCFSTLLFVRFFRARYAEKAKEVAKPRRTDIRIREEKDRPQKEKGVVRTKHHMKMGLRKASETTWLSHDTKYDVERTMRQRLIQEKGSMVIGCSPGFEKACEEALHLIVEDLTNSYPQYFLKVKSKAGDEYVEILGSNMVIPINGPGRGDVPALKVAAELVVEDLNILMKDKEGDHIL